MVVPLFLIHLSKQCLLIIPNNQWCFSLISFASNMVFTLTLWMSLGCEIWRHHEFQVYYRIPNPSTLDQPLSTFFIFFLGFWDIADF